MARLICEGFESYNQFSVDNISPRWDGLASAGNFGVSGGFEQRFSGHQFMFYLGADSYLYKVVGAQTRVILGMAIRGPGNMSGGISTNFGLLDGSTYQMITTINADGSMSWRRSNRTGTALCTSAPGLVIPDFWSYWEFDVTLHPSAGAVQMWQEGVSVASASSQNTAPTGNAQMTQLRLGAVDGSPNVAWNRIDDFYMLNTSGPAPWNARLGDNRIYALRPNGAGSSTQFTPSTGTNYQNVDEVNTNDDGDYNSTNTVGQRDLFAFQDMVSTFSGTIFNVTHTSRTRKDDAGPRTAAQVTKIGGTTTVQTAYALNTAYINRATPFDLSPATGVALTKAEIDGMEAGSELSS